MKMTSPKLSSDLTELKEISLKPPKTKKRINQLEREREREIKEK